MFLYKSEPMVESLFMHDEFAVGDSPEASWISIKN